MVVTGDVLVKNGVSVLVGGHRSTCYRNGACRSYACAQYGPAPCTSWNSPTCKNYVQQATFKC